MLGQFDQSKIAKHKRLTRSIFSLEEVHAYVHTFIWWKELKTEGRAAGEACLF